MWLYQSKEFDPTLIAENVGFVYLIINLTNNRRYIGQKKFHSTRRIKRKNKTKRVKSESDWREYYGSNQELREDVAKHGPDNFTRHILHLCKSKGWMNFIELKEQVDRNVLLDDTYYNSYIGGRIHRKHLT